ncbi:hypothetical protein GCM10028812_24060 [Ancylobacter sonchi]
MDLIRELLFRLEGTSKPLTTFVFSYGDEDLSIDGRTPDEIVAHAEMLIDGGLIEASFGASGDLIFRKLTWNGHEFLSAVRDQEIWQRTRAAAGKGGVATLDFIWEIAKAVGKKQLQEKTGLEF